MKQLFMIVCFLTSIAFAEVVMQKSQKEKPSITLPIERPQHPIRPMRPVLNTGIVYQDNYYNTNNVNHCEQYINSLNEKDQEIKALKKELSNLRSKEQLKMQKKLKEEYNQGLKDFENRKIDSTTKSRAIISDAPTVQ